MELLILSHILSDYYVQSDAIAQKKGKSIKFMLFHVIPVLLIHVIILYTFYGIKGLFSALWLSLFHVIIDIMSSGLLTFKLSKNKFINHVFDQILHLITMIIIYLMMLSGIEYTSWINQMMNINTYTSYGIQYITIITAILFLLKPMRILIDDLLEESVGLIENSQELKKSYYLGYIERLITFITVATFNYIFISALIAFKTWAQSDKLSKNINDFSKRYLIGTLASMLSAIAIAIIVIWYLQKTGFPLVKIE
ncbi:MAG TPA: DUF3307 domain-containing protein [Acholeplasmataceae bacterium]|nr:DUF3307 domain-containing protein [Acholeplasmataceae bacterium]